MMAGTMVAGMPLGAWFTNNFQYERIIVPAGLLSCGAFAGIGLSDSYVFHLKREPCCAHFASQRSSYYSMD